MVTIFGKDEDRESLFARYKAEWENGLMAAALAEAADDADKKRLLQRFYETRFNAASFHAVELGESAWAGDIDFVQAGKTQYDIVYRAPYGIVVPLGRVYKQPNGSWASLVIAGVKDDMYEALASAEWAIRKLTT